MKVALHTHRRHHTLAALILSAALVLTLAAAALAAPFSFVALGDSRGESLPQPVNVKVLSALVHKIVALKPRPAFVLFAGDFVLGQGADTDTPSLADQLKVWQQVLAPLAGAGIKVYAVPGNHEIYGAHAARREQVCREVLGELQFAFDYEGSRFICLNTDQAGHSGTADLAWLEGQLAAARAKGARHVFVIGHEPAFASIGPRYSLSNAAQFWHLLETYGADAYICGHEHLYGRSTHNGVLQIIAGGAGAPLRPFYGTEGFDKIELAYHLTLWRVDGPRVSMRALALKSGGGWRALDKVSYVKQTIPEVVPAGAKATPHAPAPPATPVKAEPAVGAAGGH